MNEHDRANKQHDIVFSIEPAGQLERALVLLAGVPDLKVARSTNHSHALTVSYHLCDYTLEGLEIALEQEGFKLDHSLLHSVTRKVIYYCEDTMCHNLDIPVHPTKKNERPIFAHAYEHTPHGDHDDTPIELRQYR